MSKIRTYLMRHSVREDAEGVTADNGTNGNGTTGTTGTTSDDAELTPEGEDIVRSVAQWMIDNDEIPTIIISSPLVRCMQTAELLRDVIKDAGFAEPDVKTDVSVGPKMSIRLAMKNLAGNPDMGHVAIVSHHESIGQGLKEMGGEPKHALDKMAMGELRIMKFKRKSLKFKEVNRVMPSDLGKSDFY